MASPSTSKTSLVNVFGAKLLRRYQNLNSHLLDNETKTSRTIIIERKDLKTPIQVCLRSEDHLEAISHLFFRLEIPNLTKFIQLYRAGSSSNKLIRGVQDLKAVDTSIQSIYMDATWQLWQDAKDFSSRDLIALVKARGQNNQINLGDPIWFDFYYVCSLLSNLDSDPSVIPWGVILLNNVLCLEPTSGSTMFLVKEKKSIESQSGKDEYISTVFRYRDSSHVARLMDPYSLTYSVSEEGDDKEKKKTIPWFQLWCKNFNRCIAKTVFECYPITDIPVADAGQSISAPEEYISQKKINSFSGYTWTFKEIKEASETHEGKEAIKFWFNTLLNIHCDGDTAIYQQLIDYFVNLVKFPGRKAMFCPYIKGQKGVGKNIFLCQPFQLLYHRHVLYRAGQALSDDFTGELREGIIYVVLDEFPNHKKNDFIEQFKAQITQPYMNIRPMYSEPMTVPNKLNICCLSNHDPPFNPTEDERRFLFSDCKYLPPQNELQKHKKRMNEIIKNHFVDNGRNTGFKAVIYALTQRDDPSDDFFNSIPVTPMFRKLLERNMSLPELFIKNCIERGGISPIARNPGEIEYNWDVDCVKEWTWAKMREAMLNSTHVATLSSSIYRSRETANDIAALKKLVLTNERDQTGRSGKIKTTFEIMSREAHYYHFLRQWPNVIFNFHRENLVITTDPFQKSARAAELNDPDFQNICAETAEWSIVDYQKALWEIQNELKDKNIQIGMNKRVRERDSQGPGDVPLKRVVILDLNEEVDS